MLKIRIDFWGGFYSVRVEHDAGSELLFVIANEALKRLVPEERRYFDEGRGEWGVEAAALDGLRFWASFCKRAFAEELQSDAPDFLWAEFPPELPADVTAEDLLNHVVRSGAFLSLSPDGRKLSLSAPASVLSPEIRLHLARLKEGLLRITRETWGPEPYGPEPGESAELVLESDAAGEPGAGPS